MRLLRDTLRALVLEAINHPGEPGQKKSARFEFNEFKKLPKLVSMIEYADSRLEYLGQGSARTVFRFTGTKVLKLANTLTKGVSQNKAEVDIYTNPKTASITTKIFDYDPKFRWLVSEIVRPFTDEDDFGQIAGVSWRAFEEMLYQRRMPEGWDDVDPEILRLMHAALTLGNVGLVEGDLTVLKHWGKTADGRVVVLDYGYTEKVQQSYGNGRYEDEDMEEEKPEKVDWNEPVKDAEELGVRSGGMRPPVHKLPPKMAALIKNL